MFSYIFHKQWTLIFKHLLARRLLLGSYDSVDFFRIDVEWYGLEKEVNQQVYLTSMKIYFDIIGECPCQFKVYNQLVIITTNDAF